MRPLIYEMWVLTYQSDDRKTTLFNDEVYLDLLPAKKARWYQNGPQSRRLPNSPRLEVLTMEQYIRARESESENRGELRGKYPEHY